MYFLARLTSPRTRAFSRGGRPTETVKGGPKLSSMLHQAGRLALPICATSASLHSLAGGRDGHPGEAKLLFVLSVPLPDKPPRACLSRVAGLPGVRSGVGPHSPCSKFPRYETPTARHTRGEDCLSQ